MQCCKSEKIYKNVYPLSFEVEDLFFYLLQKHN